MTERYPLAYNANELSIVLSVPLRTMWRIIGDLEKAGFIQKYHMAYRLNIDLVENIMNGKHFAKKDKEKDLWLTKTRLSK